MDLWRAIAARWRVSVGLASLDDRRNRIVEPGCPPAAERLASIGRLAMRRLPVVLRIDRSFPTSTTISTR